MTESQGSMLFEDSRSHSLPKVESHQPQRRELHRDRELALSSRDDLLHIALRHVLLNDLMSASVELSLTDFHSALHTHTK